jgi:HEAT repeat protein
MSALGDLLADLASGDNQRAESAANALPGHGQTALEKLVRYCAVLAVGKHHHNAAINKLIRALDSDDSLLVRLAADALIAIGSPALESLLNALDTTSASARVEAARALALIGDTRAIPVLFKMLDSDSVMMQHWANEGLEKMGVGMDFLKP